MRLRFRYLLMLFLLLTGVNLSLMAVPVGAQSCVIRSDWPTYSVARGDTLYRIATRFHTTTSALAAANCVSNASLIFVGQVLRVPPGSGGSTVGTFAVAVTFQQYEKGFMIWRSDTGDVWVYVGSASGAAMRYATNSYGQLPENPVTDTMPAGRVRPIMGFGRVWGNFALVRSALGWATTAERSYSMLFNPASTSTFYFTLPDGRTAVTNNGQAWSLSNAPFPTPLPTTPPQPIPPPIGNVNVDVRASYQPFDAGFMIWRSDTGEIGVYFGSNGGVAGGYLVQTYSSLPDNPFFNVPAGHVRPIMGIGKVWGNFPDVRTGLGWATGPEQVYTLRFRVSPGSTTAYLTIPDGRIISNDRNRFWGFTNNPPLPIPTVTPAPVPPTGSTIVTVSAAYQLFENGFMIWQGDTGRINLFTKTYVAGYNQDQYQYLADNPVPDQPPAGRFKPINGFGRVWGNFADTRAQMGWGLANEQGYQATFKTDLATNVICVNLPDGRFVSYPHYDGNRSWFWQYENSCG